MKNLLFLIVLFFASVSAFSQVSVRGYYRSNGTYVQPHQRTAPNYTRNDNYSTMGNVNPYTGKAGTQPRDGGSTYTSSRAYSTSSYNTTYSTPNYPTTTYSTPSYSTPSYNSSNTIYTGSRGGQYYINSNGNKTYVSSY